LPNHARWLAQRAYNGQLLQLLRTLPSGSIVALVFVILALAVLYYEVELTWFSGRRLTGSMSGTVKQL